MNINELTIGQAKDLAAMFLTPQNAIPFVVGKNYFFRTITHHLTGHVESVHGKFLKLSTAAWIADDGRFSEAMKNGVFSEVEPFSQHVFINTDSLIDAVEWQHALPTETK